MTQEDASADPRGATPERSAERKRTELDLAARSRRFALIADISGRLLLRGEPREQLKQAFDAVAHEVGSDLYFNYLVGPG